MEITKLFVLNTSDFVFSFVVQNPGFAQKAAAVSIEVSGGLNLPRQKMNFGTSDLMLYPLVVTGPTFVTSEIGQSTSFPSYNNQITVTFSANIKLTEGSIITLSSLGKNVTASWMPLDTVNLTGDSSYFSDSPGGSDSKGILNSLTETLKLFVLKPIDAFQTIVISFNVTNPGCFRPAADVCIAASNILTENCPHNATIERSQIKVRN
ncbi:hypothetical protein GUITHDRAFT_154549, partial [Guillardia theta CCMP2712]